MNKLLIIFAVMFIGSCTSKSSDDCSAEKLVEVEAGREILPAGAVFPIENVKSAKVETLAKFELFPEGPSYRPEDGSYFFAGNNALSRVTKEGKMHVLIPREEFSGGGTHILPDKSILIIGHKGLRRVFPDGKMALLVDAKDAGPGNDISMDANGTIYFSVPSKGVFRLESGKDSKVELIVPKRGLNGLDVDPKGEYLYINRGKRIVRHKILGRGKPLGDEEHIYEFNSREIGGADGCTFDAYGNFWFMHFRAGKISVINPQTKKLIVQRDCGVAPATNLAFCGPDFKDLMITAGAPKFKNCSILKMKLNIQGFRGHPGSTEYSMVKYLNETVNVEELNN